MRAAPAAAASGHDRATYRTFDGQVIEFTGHREGDKAFVTDRDAPRSGARRAVPGARARGRARRRTPAAATRRRPTPHRPPPAKAADQTAETLGARAQGLEFEIPVYKYEAIFKKQEDLLEKPPAKAGEVADVAASARSRDQHRAPPLPSNAVGHPGQHHRARVEHHARRFRACAARGRTSRR